MPVTVSRHISMFGIACGVFVAITLASLSFLDARVEHLLAQQEVARRNTLPIVPTSVFTSTANPSTTTYVVERDWSNGTASEEQGRILAVDTGSLQTVGQIDTLYDPQLALAPDGKRLLVAETVLAGDMSHERLRVIDTANGQTLDTVSLPNRFRSKITVAPGVLAVSRDGRYVHYETVKGTNDRDTHYAIATYDSATRALLPHDIALPSFCARAMVWPLPTEGTIVAVCLGHAHSVTVADVPSGKASTLAVPDPPGFINGIPKGGETTGLVGSTMSRDGTSIYLVTKAGTIHHFDLASHTFLPSIPLDLGHDKAMAHDQIQLSRDGQRLYLGVGRTEVTWSGMSEQVQVYDTATWKLVQTVEPAEPMRSIALTPDEDLLMLHSTSRTMSRWRHDVPDSAPATAIETPGSHLYALVTVP